MSVIKQKLINQIFQDIALLLGGVVALHRNEISDDVVWMLTKDLKRLHAQYTNKPKKNQKVDLKPHPAIADLIKKVRISQNQADEVGI